MKKSMHRLPDAELEVMQALWQCKAPASRADIEQKLDPAHPMAATTLLTLLGRLADRVFAAVQKEGRRSLFTPLEEQKDYQAAQSGSFVQKLFGGSMTAFAAALCSSGLSREDLDELRELLEKGEL